MHTQHVRICGLKHVVFSLGQSNIRDGTGYARDVSSHPAYSNPGPMRDAGLHELCRIHMPLCFGFGAGHRDIVVHREKWFPLQGERAHSLKFF